MSKGGCGLELAKVKDMLYFNPMYRHKADKLAVKLQLELVEPLTKHGSLEGNSKASKDKNRPDNVKSVSNDKASSKGGNSADYLAAKLKRDHPDIASKIESGEYKSIHAAALDAGIVRKKYQIEATVESVKEFCKRHSIDSLIADLDSNCLTDETFAGSGRT